MSSDGDDSHKKSRIDILGSTQAFIDSHIQLVRNSVFIFAGVGLVIAARGLYLSKVFTKVEDIPASFVKKKVRLQGKVKKINDEDILWIEHIPVIRLPQYFTRQNKHKELLPVHLACIDVSPEGRLWLKDNILQQIVWFHLLHRTQHRGRNQSQLYSRIELPRRLYRSNIYVNEELVKLGLAKISSISDIEEISDMQADTNLLNYLDKLIKLENYASEKGCGMWMKSTDESKSSKVFNTIKHAIYSPYRFIKWISTRRKKE